MRNTKLPLLIKTSSAPGIVTAARPRTRWTSSSLVSTSRRDQGCDELQADNLITSKFLVQKKIWRWNRMASVVDPLLTHGTNSKSSTFGPMQKCSLPHRTTGVGSGADISKPPIEAFRAFHSNFEECGILVSYSAQMALIWSFVPARKPSSTSFKQLHSQ